MKKFKSVILEIGMVADTREPIIKVALPGHDIFKVVQETGGKFMIEIDEDLELIYESDPVSLKQ